MATFEEAAQAAFLGAPEPVTHLAFGYGMGTASFISSAKTPPLTAEISRVSEV